MRQILRFFVYGLSLIMLALGCAKAPFLSLGSSRNMSFSDQGGVQDIMFTTNQEWTVSSSVSWCNATPSSGASSNESIKVSISCEPNTTYDSRNCILAIMVGELVETITVVQETNYALLISPSSFELSSEAQTIDVKIQTNVDYTVEINPDCQDWISAFDTKSLSSDNLYFKIEANESYDPREGTILIKQSSGSIYDGITIKQREAEEPSAIPIEDPVFKAFLVKEYDTNGDGEISGREALNITTIEVETVNIHSLQGIEYMFNLESLSCYGVTGTPSDGKLKSLNVSKNKKLKYLDCFANQISNLDVTYNMQLTTLYCDCNFLTTLDISNNRSLSRLSCSFNQLSFLDFTNNTALQIIDCSNNKLSHIDVTGITNLSKLHCSSNEISALDISKHTNLTSLNCFNNHLVSLDVSNNNSLVLFECGMNQLSSIDVTDKRVLKYFNCYDNPLSTLDVSNNSFLVELNCTDCQLTSLDVTQNKRLEVLECAKNQITSLDISNNLRLWSLFVEDNKLTSLDVSNNPALSQIDCMFNFLTSLDVSQNLELYSLRCSPMIDSSGRNLLSILYVSQGQIIPNVTVNRSVQNIPYETQIVIK